MLENTHCKLTFKVTNIPIINVYPTSEVLKNHPKEKITQKIEFQKYEYAADYIPDDEIFDEKLTKKEREEIDDYIRELTLSYEILKNVWFYEDQILNEDDILEEQIKCFCLYFVFGTYNIKENRLNELLDKLKIICNRDLYKYDNNLIYKYYYLCHKMSQYFNHKIFKINNDYREEKEFVTARSINFVDIVTTKNYEFKHDVISCMKIQLIGCKNDD